MVKVIAAVLKAWLRRSEWNVFKVERFFLSKDKLRLLTKSFSEKLRKRKANESLPIPFSHAMRDEERPCQLAIYLQYWN